MSDSQPLHDPTEKSDSQPPLDPTEPALSVQHDKVTDMNSPEYMEHVDGQKPPMVAVGGQSLSVLSQTTTIESISRTVNQMYDMSHQNMAATYLSLLVQVRLQAEATKWLALTPVETTGRGICMDIYVTSDQLVQGNFQFSMGAKSIRF